MPMYRYNFVSADDRVQSTAVVSAGSDDEAREIARELVRISEHPIIEVWRGTTLILKTGKSDPDPNSGH